MRARHDHIEARNLDGSSDRVLCGDHGHIVLADNEIPCDQRGTFDDCMGNQHSVEWIAVMAGKSFGCQCMCHRDLERTKTTNQNSGLKVARCIQFAQAALDGNSL